MPRRARTAAGLIGVALAAWIVTVERTRGMDMRPGTGLPELGSYVGLWVTMTAAMMLPSAAPTVLVFARISHQRRRRAPSISIWFFGGGYLVAWTGYGLAAYAASRGIDALDLGFLSWGRQGPLVAGGALVIAGAYQLTPFKLACLRHCRSPLHFVLHGWRDGNVGALRMGAAHGAYCVGCCWGLMLALFGLGVMSVTWMAVVATLIFAEKVLASGARFSFVVALALLTLGVWVALAPGTVPD